MEIEHLYRIFLRHPSVQTDSRKLSEGDIFFALKGPNFNGNTFAQKAIDAGASLVIVDEPVTIKSDKIVQVSDSLQCLQQLASFHRDHFQIPFIAITGSNGKTTTKELIHAVLSREYRTYTTQGNLNNHIGIPLTLLRVGSDAGMAVIEMGASHQHEIEGYCSYTKPTFGLITNIGRAHLEGFGGEEGVKKGKGELFRYIGVHDGVAFVNADDPRVLEVSAPVQKRVFYGDHPDGLTAKIISRDPLLVMELDGEKPLEISTQLVGDYNIHNVLAAAAVGRYFSVPDQHIKEAIENYSPSNSRSQMIRKDSNTIIMDAYNANPDSMEAAIENFAAMNATRKVLILGDMKELGEHSLAEHQKIVELIKKYKWSAVALTGPMFSAVHHNFHQFTDWDNTRDWFIHAGFQNSFMLVKGSRSMQMEKVVS